MKLQVIIEPPNGGARSKKRKLQDDRVRRFVEIAPATVTLDDLCANICQRYKKLYTGMPDLIIYKLQDFEGNDLDLSYKVGDVFVDKDNSSEGSTVRVFQVVREREVSLPPESALRPRKRHRVSSPQLDSVVEESTSDRGSRPPPAKRIRRRTSALSLQEIVEDSSEEREFKKANDSSREASPVSDRKGKKKHSIRSSENEKDSSNTGDESEDDRRLKTKPSTNTSLSRRSPLLGGTGSSYLRAGSHGGNTDNDDNEDDDDNDDDAEEDEDDDEEEEEEEEEEDEKNGNDQKRGRSEIQVPSTEPEVVTSGGTSQDSISDSTPPVSIKKGDNEATAPVSRLTLNHRMSEEFSSPPAPRKIVEVQIIRPTTITYQSKNRTPMSKRLRSNAGSIKRLEDTPTAHRVATTDSFDFIPSEDESSKSPETSSKTGIKPTARKSMLAQLGSNISSKVNQKPTISKPPAHQPVLSENTVCDKFLEEELAQSQKAAEVEKRNDHRRRKEISDEEDEEVSSEIQNSSKEAKNKRTRQRGKSKADTSPAIASSDSGDTSITTKPTPVPQRRSKNKEVDDSAAPMHEADSETNEDDNLQPSDSIEHNGERRTSKGTSTRASRSTKQGGRTKASSVEASPSLDEQGNQRRRSVTFAKEPQVKEPTPASEKPASARKNTIIPPPVPVDFVGSSKGRFSGPGHRRKKPPGPVNTPSKSRSPPPESKAPPSKPKSPPPKSQSPAPKSKPPASKSKSLLKSKSPPPASNTPKVILPPIPAKSTNPVPAVATAQAQVQLPPIPPRVSAPNPVQSTVGNISSDENVESEESDEEQKNIDEDTESSSSGSSDEENGVQNGGDDDVEDDSDDSSSNASDSSYEEDSGSRSPNGKAKFEKSLSLTDKSQPILQDTEMEDVGADVEDNIDIDMELDTQDAAEIESPLFARRPHTLQTLKTSRQEISMPARAVEDEKADEASDDGEISSSVRSTPPRAQRHAKARENALALSDVDSSLPEPKSPKEGADEQEQGESDSSEETESSSDEAEGVEGAVANEELSSQSGSSTASSSESETDNEEDEDISRNGNLRSASPKVVPPKKRQTATRSLSPEKELITSAPATTTNQTSNGKHSRATKNLHAHPSPPTSGNEGAVLNGDGVEAAAAAAVFNMKKGVARRDHHSSPARKGNRRSETPLRNHDTTSHKEASWVSASQPVRARSRSNTPNNNLHPPTNRGQVRKLSPAKIAELASSNSPSSQTKLPPSSQHGQWLSLSQLMQQNVPETRERAAKASAEGKSSQSQPKTPLPRVPQSDSDSDSESEGESGSGSGSGSENGSDGDDDDSSDGSGASRSVIPPEQMAAHNTQDLSRQNKGIKSLLNFRSLFRSSQG